ncbi:hypothetical protein ACFQU9_00550 [Actinomadura namibiensis]|uniref:Uncharacterized protein n=1 Tax=Actinomadura namibiensis TaxID=182080 RepID=A0A7W3LNC1_ACTNM|nr:hypothetical protein [Actinomadura namibiensis]MBA8951305.1 hypothetical protein [Actinomadura namibiensis]
MGVLEAGDDVLLWAALATSTALAPAAQPAGLTATIGEARCPARQAPVVVRNPTDRPIDYELLQDGRVVRLERVPAGGVIDGLAQLTEDEPVELTVRSEGRTLARATRTADCARTTPTGTTPTGTVPVGTAPAKGGPTSAKPTAGGPPKGEPTADEEADGDGAVKGKDGIAKGKGGKKVPARSGPRKEASEERERLPETGVVGNARVMTAVGGLAGGLVVLFWGWLWPTSGRGDWSAPVRRTGG